MFVSLGTKRVNSLKIACLNCMLHCFDLLINFLLGARISMCNQMVTTEIRE